MKVAAYPNYIYQPQKKVMRQCFHKSLSFCPQGEGRTSLVPGPLGAVGYIWSQVLSRGRVSLVPGSLGGKGRVGYLRGRYPGGHIEVNFEGTYDCH